MFKNYFKIGFRNLVKQKIYSVINILGLSIGLASVIMIFMHVEDEFSYDRFHDNGDQIYKVFLERAYPDHVTKYAVIPHSFSEVLVQDLPEVENAARVFANNADVQVSYTNEDDEINVFEERNLILADSTFFDVFSIELIKGEAATALSNPQDMVITEETAYKYFGEEDPLNKTLQTDFGQFNITGVCKALQGNSHFEFDFIGSIETFPFFQTVNFTGFSAHTYLQLTPESDPKQVEDKFPQIVENYAGPQIEQNLNTTYEEYVAAGNGYKYSLVNIKDIYLNPVKYENQIKPGGSSTYVFIFISIAVLILVIACINFMNLATARSAERSKEVGIRKTLGSNKSQLINQFLIESILISFISLIIAVGIIYLTLPSFNSLAGKNLELLSTDSYVLPVIFLFSIVVGLLAGSYPAFVLSSFNPSVVLKGNQYSSAKGSLLRNGLVVFQFFVSILLIIGTLVVQKQMDFMQNKDLGYNKDNVILIERAGFLQEQTQTFMDEIKQIPYVKGVGGSSTIPGRGYFGIQFTPEGGSEVITANSMVIDDYYGENIGFEVVEGRGFSEDFNDSLAMLINEQTKDLLGVENVIGMRLQNNVGGEPPVFINYEVVGVVRDFHYMSLHNKISPFIIMNTESGRQGIGLISIRTDEHYQEVLAGVETKWKEIVPEQPFKYAFMDEDLARQYENEAKSGKLLTVFAVLGIIIACVGLFGLAAFTAGLRTKEIGVRKVMGASVISIVAMLSKDFTILIITALVVAVPVAWFGMQSWLENFAYQVDVGVGVFFIAGLTALMIAWITVSYQSIKAAIANPVKSLKDE
jgi:putative ABC transport system permease protein